jgi:hypothetical protein
MTLKQAEQAIANRKGFVSGNLKGIYLAPHTYAVYSYDEEIAVSAQFTDGSWVDGVSKFAYIWSKTTSKHANIVKRAWGLS